MCLQAWILLPPHVSDRTTSSSTGRVTLDTNQMAAFAQLGLDEWLVQQCKSVGLKKPTPIQEKCVQPILEGESLSLSLLSLIHI